MKTAYYARPISIYNTPQEERDIAIIRSLGFEPIDINKKELQEAYEEKGMDVFLEFVQQSSALFFRSQINGQIGAGVWKEIEWAMLGDIPVVELPTMMVSRIASVDETRAYLKEVGFR